MDGQAGERTGGRADGRTGGRADGRTGGRADGRTGGRADGRTGGRAGGNRKDGLNQIKEAGHFYNAFTKRPFQRSPVSDDCPRPHPTPTS